MASKKKTTEQKEEVKATKKKISNIPSRTARAEAFREQFNKDMRGRAMLMSASDYMLPFMYKRLPTGLLTLDAELKGGFPAGGISQIKGPKNVGKTWTACQLIRQLQTFLGNKMHVLIAMTEMRFDRGQARMTGVKIDMGEETVDEMNRGRIANGHPPFTLEEVRDLRHQVGVIDEMHGLGAEDLFQGILQAVEENCYHLIIIDSFGSILTAAQQEDDMASKSYGGASGPITTFLKKLAGLLTFNDEHGRVRDVCIIGINQVRDNIGDPNKPWRTTGGRALEHALFTDVMILPGKFLGAELPIFTPEGTKKRWVNTGKEVHWSIEKGKAGIHEGGRGTYVYDYRINNVDFYADTMVAGVQNKVIQVEGAWYGIPNPDKEGEFLIRAQGRDNFVQALAADAAEKAAAGKNEDSVMNYIRSEVFKSLDINISYEWAD